MIDDSEEFDFIQHQERRSTDDRNYSIGDMAYDTLESKEYSPGIMDSIKANIRNLKLVLNCLDGDCILR